MWREATPVGAIADLRAVYGQAGKNRWWLMGLAALSTIATFSLITKDSWKAARPLPEITYITSWPEHRTDAETQAFIKENQRRKEAREAAEAKLREEERKMYKALGRASGLDVDEMERRADADRARDEAAAKAEADAVLKKHAEPGRAPVARQR